MYAMCCVSLFDMFVGICIFLLFYLCLLVDISVCIPVVASVICVDFLTLPVRP